MEPELSLLSKDKNDGACGKSDAAQDEAKL